MVITYQSKTRSSATSKRTGRQFCAFISP